VTAVAVVVVTHQGSTDMLRRCLASIHHAGGADLVVVVDNSGRTSAQVDIGPVDHIVSIPNSGFGAAANRGARQAVEQLGGTPAIALLNDDVEVTPGWLRPLRDALEVHPDLGAVQPKLLLAGGPMREPALQEPTEPAPVPIVNSVGVALDQFGAGSDIGFGEVDDRRWAEARSIDIFTGGAVLLRHEFLVQTSGFDERLFLYYEDVDLSLRGRDLGWRYRCEPSSVVHHGSGSSTAALGAQLAYYQERNRLVTAFRFGSISLIRRAVWLSIRRVRHRPRRAHLRALGAGLAGAPRALRARRSANRAPTSTITGV
jgi:GT2 family glycosyltransferase